jgi:hypothetical protein
MAYAVQSLLASLENIMSRYLAFLFFLTSCAHTTLSQEPESCPMPYVEAPSVVAAKVTPTSEPEEPLFLVPAQSLFSKDLNNLDDRTGFHQCELFGGKISLVMGSEHNSAQQRLVSIRTSKEPPYSARAA